MFRAGGIDRLHRGVSYASLAGTANIPGYSRSPGGSRLLGRGAPRIGSDPDPHPAGCAYAPSAGTRQGEGGMSMTQPCDNESWVTLPALGGGSEKPLHVTGMAAIQTSRHTCTCVFPGERIAVIHVTGATSQEEARAAVLAAWQPCRYAVQDGDPTN